MWTPRLLGRILPADIIGRRGHGWQRHISARSGRLHGGVTPAVTMSGTPATGDRMSDSMAESITALAIPVEAFMADIGEAALSTYNRTVMNVNTTVVRNVYERRVTNYTPVNRISYNGGHGGINLKPTDPKRLHARAANGTGASAGSISTRGRGESRAIRHGKWRPSQCSRARPTAARDGCRPSRSAAAPKASTW